MGDFGFFWAEGGTDGLLVSVAVTADSKAEAWEKVGTLAGTSVAMNDEYETKQVGSGVRLKSISFPSDASRITYSGQLS